MIDFHSHVLPGIDDGSRDLAETERLLRAESEQGVDTVVCTPHFYAQKVSFGHFLERRQHALEKVEEWAKDKPWVPRLIPAAEVYYFPGMGKAQALPELTVLGTDLLLLEMPFAQWTGSVYREVKDIVEKQGLTVILAHIERFYPFQKDRAVWDDVLDLPLYLQINAECLLSWGTRRIAKKILSTGLPVVMGSDCHNMSRRPPNLDKGREVLRRKMGEEVLLSMDETAERLLKEHARA